MRRLASLLLLAVLCSGCAALRFAMYVLTPDYPTFRDGEVVAIAGLRGAVEVARKPDGLWRISAADERDAMLAVGYLQARDRMAQLDLFRHMARGELAQFIGNQTLGDRSAVDLDRLNRFLGFRDRATYLYEHTSASERQAIDGFALGVNAWIAQGQRSLEHRLLGIDAIRPWTALDSLAIYQLIMHGLSGNADREVRRLMIACEAGLDALERIWPNDIEFDVHALPDEDLRAQDYPPQPAVVKELADELPTRCAEGAADTYDPLSGPAAVDRDARFSASLLPTLAVVLAQGWSASNNWAVSGAHTKSGKPILSSDPHLPHMNPPLLWGMDVEYAGHRVAGFTLPGLHRVVFGHNGRVAWGATTNHVDRQDLIVHRARTEVRNGVAVSGYEVEGEFVSFDYRTEVFEIRGGNPIRAVVRFTKDGPLLNDLEPVVARKIPLTALRLAPPGNGTDLDAARAINHARTAQEFADGIALIDLGCSSWVFADADGSIGFRSPCVVPIREGWSGTFPAPGWLRRYEWRGVYAKTELPSSTNPARGWLATANSQVVPSKRFPTAYNNDVSAPNRFLRIVDRLHAAIAHGGLTAASSAAIQLDTQDAQWPALRAELEPHFCSPAVRSDADRVARARRLLCAWDGTMHADSPAATLYVLLSNAMLDAALADELRGGSQSATWKYTQSLLQFEADVQWLWSRPESAPVWDDVTTPAVETKSDILEQALVRAVAVGSERYGENPETWLWGRVRPFVLRHPFAPRHGFLAAVLNSEPMAVGGDTETVFKQQFVRADREHMHPVVGPVVRFTVDLADPWRATYSLAGGESGWPKSPYYGNLLDDWRTGRGRPLTPPASSADTHVRFVPAT